jgi:hypothetical protein
MPVGGYDEGVEEVDAVFWWRWGPWWLIRATPVGVLGSGL